MGGKVVADSMRKRILVAVDGSEQALSAVQYVGSTVASLPVEVVLLNIMTKIPESFWDLEKEPTLHNKVANIRAWEVQQEKMIQEFMKGAQGALMDAGIPQDSITIKIQERNVGIARDILAESRNGYNAVVLARRGLSELKDLVLGSISSKLVEKLSDVPVWVVGSRTQHRRVLVSMDASEGARQAIEYVATTLGPSADFHITLLHIIRDFDVFQQILGKAFMPGDHQDWIDRAKTELQNAAREIEPVFEQSEARLVAAGFDPNRLRHKVLRGAASRAGSIVQEAQDGGYDTIVLGRRGLSRVQEFFMGRVSNKVIQLAKDKTVWIVS